MILKRPTIITVLILLFVMSLAPVLRAQDTTTTSTPIEFTGTVDNIEGTTITVGGLTVDVSSIDASIVGQLTINTTVSISGTLENGVVTAITIVIVNAGPVVPPPDGLLLNTFVVSYGGRVFDGSQTTFTYIVSGTGAPPDLSHFDVEIPHCVPPLEVIAFSPTDAVEFGVDPTTGVDGIKWDSPLGMNETRTYTLTFFGFVAEGTVVVAVKDGDGFTTGSLPGPSCNQPAIDVEKFVSVDGITWLDADDAPGPDVDPASQVSFRFVVTNVGNVPLESVTLTDDSLDGSACLIPTTLEPEAAAECVVGPLAAAEGQHVNVATATALFAGETISDTDAAHYFSGDLPAIDVEKYVSVDNGATWRDADSAPGPDVQPEMNVLFRLVVTNTGNVPLSAITLSDTMFDTSGCPLPPTLQPGAPVECILGPFPAAQGQHTNTATASGDFQGTVVSDSDAAHYFGRSEPVVINGFVVVFVSRVFVNNQTTFTYTVTGTGVPPDLSHFDIEIPICTPRLEVVSTSPASPVEFGIDPTTGINGVKWDLPLKVDESRTYSITFAGNVELGTVLVAVKGGPGFEAFALPGPSCEIPAIDVEKSVSVDGGITWLDADAAPGPDVELGADVWFRFIVTNNGSSTLAGISLTDSVYDVSSCALPAILEPDAFFECEIGPFPAEEGQHTNVATATGVFGGGAGFTTDSDAAHYFGGDRPAISIQKYVSVNDGATWLDADGAPGPHAEIGADVSFGFDVKNEGNVPLTGIGLTDSDFDTGSCALPDTLDPGANFRCEIGPFPAEAGQHANTARVSTGEGVSDTDDAHYFGGELDDDDDTSDLPITIIIEGPVEAININIITIFGINIEIDPDDPLLTVIRIGDEIRVEGDTVSDGNIIIIVAINIIIIDTDIIIIDDDDDGPPVVWRDSGESCGNPPPPWAPALGWRARCEGAPHPAGPGRGSGRSSRRSS
jgi:hypothetical protein